MQYEGRAFWQVNTAIYTSTKDSCAQFYVNINHCKEATALRDQGWHENVLEASLPPGAVLLVGRKPEPIRRLLCKPLRGLKSNHVEP